MKLERSRVALPYAVYTIFATAAAVLLQSRTAAAQIPLPGGIQINCSEPLTRLLGHTITIGPANVCHDFGLEGPKAFPCAVQNILSDISKQVTGACLPHKQAPVKSVSARGEVIPKPLPDRRPLPAGKFADTAAVLAEEGPTHYWYITNVINLFVWAPCKGSGKNYTSEFLVPDGWKLVHLEHLPAALGANSSAALPLMAVLRSQDGKQLAFILRGTRTAQEWQADLSYAQVSDPHYPGSVARGFSSSANLVWPAVEAALQQQVLNGTVTAVTLAGHSLGAAMATLLAFRAQVFLDRQIDNAAAAAAGGGGSSKARVTVGALLFAAPNVGDDDFVADFNSRVNARRISYAYDLIPQVPCAPKMMACAGSVFEAARPGVASWSYATVGGHITIGPSDMPIQPEVWAKTDTANPCMMLPWAVATHVCSYTCYYSQAAADETNGRCKLWGKKAAEGPSTDFCIWYPYKNPEYPLSGNGSVLVVGSKPPNHNKPVELMFSFPGLLGR